MWHINDFSVTPGHRSSRPGTRFLPAGYPDENVYVPWVPHTAHKLLTPGHRSGDPPPSGRETPPRPGSHRKNLFMFMCLFLSWPPDATAQKQQPPRVEAKAVEKADQPKSEGQSQSLLSLAGIKGVLGFGPSKPERPPPVLQGDDMTQIEKDEEGRDLYNTHKQPVDDLAKNIFPPREWTILHQMLNHERSERMSTLVGLRTQTQNAAFFERKGPKRKPWPRGKSLNRKKWSQCVFWTLAF